MWFELEPASLTKPNKNIWITFQIFRTHLSIPAVACTVKHTETWVPRILQQCVAIRSLLGQFAAEYGRTRRLRWIWVETRKCHIYDLFLTFFCYFFDSNWKMWQALTTFWKIVTFQLFDFTVKRNLTFTGWMNTKQNKTTTATITIKTSSLLCWSELWSNF